MEKARDVKGYEHEQALLDQYKPYLNKLVRDFMMKTKRDNRAVMLDADDLRQEVYIAFFNIVRTEGEDHVTRRYYTFLHVMYDAVRRANPVSMPYHAFREKLFVPVVAWENMEQYPSGECVEDTALIHAEVEQMDSVDQRIIRLKIEGCTNHEVALQLGLTDVQVSRRLKRIRKSISIQTDVKENSIKSY